MNYFYGVIWIGSILHYGCQCMPLNEYFLRTYSLQHRLGKRDNVYDPPVAPFPSKENAPFWNPAPYPVPTTAAPPPVVRRKLSKYDPNNPYLDAMTDPYYPNYGLGFSNARPTLVGGSLNWPTGNALMPSDHFNGTIGYATPQNVRVGMQGGPLYPWQSPQFMRTASDINQASSVQQAARFRSQQQQQQMMSSSSQHQAAVPNGFIPVQQQFLDQPAAAAQQGAGAAQQPQQQQSPPASPVQPPQLQAAAVPASAAVNSPNNRQLSFARPFTQ